MTPAQMAQHNGEAYAYPSANEVTGRDGTLTKRELFAVRIMQGLVAKYDDQPPANLTELAVSTADALLVQLQRPRNGKTTDFERALDRPTAAKDIARYEWLRKNWLGIAVHTALGDAGLQVTRLEVSGRFSDFDPSSLDRAIDTAIAREQEQRGQDKSVHSEQSELL